MSQQRLHNYTLLDLYEQSLVNYADQIAFHSDAQSFTYKEVDDVVKQLQKDFRAQGIRQGDKIALVSENMPHWGIVYLAVTTMGAIIVPILPDFHNSQIRHIIRSSEAQGLICSSKKEEIFEEIEEDESFDNIHFFMNLESLQLLPSHKHPKLGLLQKIEKSFKKDSVEVATPLSVTIQEDDVASLIYTSGTSGHSKGVMLTHKNLTSNAESIRTIYQVTKSDSFVSLLPLAHTFECTVGFLMPFLNGASVYYLTKTPTPTVLKKALAEVQPTCMLSVPLIIEKIYKTNIQPKLEANAVIRTLHKIPMMRKKIHQKAGQKMLEFFGGRLKFYGIGGAALSAHVEKFLLESGFPYIVGYGLTETSPLVAAAHPRHRKFRSTGPAMEKIQVKLIDVNEKTGEGELVIKGPNVMKGYYHNEEATKEVLSSDGWFKTGDLASIDKDGYIFIQGRSKNMILGPSGENIYPEQIESVILAFEMVADALVYEKDGKLAAKIHLDYEKFDQLHAKEKLSTQEEKEKIEALLEELKEQTNQQMSKFSKISAFYEQQEPFEKTPTKKTKRYLYI